MAGAVRVFGYERSRFQGNAPTLVVTYADSVNAPRAGARPTIDGNLTEWQALSQTLLNKDTAVPSPARCPPTLTSPPVCAPPGRPTSSTSRPHQRRRPGRQRQPEPWGDDVIELGIHVPQHRPTHQFTLALDGRRPTRATPSPVSPSPPAPSPAAGRWRSWSPAGPSA